MGKMVEEGEKERDGTRDGKLHLYGVVKLQRKWVTNE